MVELMGGIDPARVVVEAALAAGKPVVTGNKELIAANGADLARAAAQAGVDLLYEAAVAGAIPLVRALRDSLAGESVWRVMGIVNGTTNFILTMMADEGVAYEEALGEAQRLGLAERDPTADVEGYDAAAKVAILAGLAFRCDLPRRIRAPRGDRRAARSRHRLRRQARLRREAAGGRRAHRLEDHRRS